MSRRSVPTSTLVSRRRVVRMGVAAVAAAPLAALAGCGQRDPASRSPEAGSGGEPGTDPAADADTDPDTALLEAVLSEVDATAALVATLRRRERDLRQPLAAVAATHDAHRTRLATAAPQRPDPTDSADSAGTTGDLPRGRVAALDVVRRQEQALQDRLTSAAVEAESGTFARMLASMAGAIAQHRTSSPLADA